MIQFAVPYRINEGDPLLLPEYTAKVADGGTWALYINHLISYSFLVTKMWRWDNSIARYVPDGWRIRHIPGIVQLSWAQDFIKSCGGCLNPER